MRLEVFRTRQYLLLPLVFLVMTVVLLVGRDCEANKPKLYHKHVKFINFYFPINPHVQKLYKKGYKGGYGKKYKDYHRGEIKNFKYPFRLHVSFTTV